MDSKKSNEVKDRRFGANDPTMTKDEKQMRKMKKLASQKSKYALNEEAEEENAFYGQSLGDLLDAKLDAMGEDETQPTRRYNEEEAWEEKMDAEELVKQLREKGLNLGTNKESTEDEKKSRKEIMAEVMKKAKLFKMERQREQEENEDMIEDLDNKLPDLFKSGALAMKPSKKEKEFEEMMTRAQNKGTSQVDDVNQDQEDIKEDVGKFDDYEELVRGFQFDAKQAATDRTKTPEEKAQEEHTKLVEMEKDRQRRMMGEEFSDGESEEDDDDESGLTHKEKRRKHRKKQKLINKRFREEEDDAEEVDVDKASKRKLDDLKAAQEELPYILECPSTHVELVLLLRKHPRASLDAILKRIRTSTSIHLLAENRSKLELFIKAMMDHVIYVADTSQPSSLEVLTKHIYFASLDIPFQVSQIFQSKLVSMQRNLEGGLRRSNQLAQGGGDLGMDDVRVGLLQTKKKGGHKGQKGQLVVEEEEKELQYKKKVLNDDAFLSSPARCWPTAGELAFFRLVASVFPVTDFTHRVLGPAKLLLGQYLSLCPVRGMLVGGAYC